MQPEESICRTCGNCCKVLRFWVHGGADFISRLSYLATSTIKTIPTKIICDGKNVTLVEIHSKCEKLITKNGLYTCSIYNTSEKPDMCSKFPDNLFVDFEEKKIDQDTENIKNIIESYQDFCPLFRDVDLRTIQGYLKYSQREQIDLKSFLITQGSAHGISDDLR